MVIIKTESNYLMLSHSHLIESPAAKDTSLEADYLDQNPSSDGRVRGAVS